MNAHLKLSKILIIILFPFYSLSVNAQDNINREFNREYQVNRSKKIFNIPDIPGYLTLKGDFHTHTIFSDGAVSPEFRIIEAWSEDLDIIAITDHIEHRVNKKILPEDLNLGYERARSTAEELNILLVPGTEISKKMPNPGHFNALFVKDVNKLINEDPMIQIEEAINQGAFILWNHPGSSWIKPIIDTTKFWDIHKSLLAKGWLHGIEVFNTDEWFPIALEWCISNKLTVFSNTDIHTPINYWYDLSNSGNHRAMTLVFAEERSLNSVKDALFENRTIGFFGKILVGTENLIADLFNASVKLKKPYKQSKINGKLMDFAELENPTDLSFILKKSKNWMNNDRTDVIELLPRSISIVSYPSDLSSLEFQLTNCYSDINKHPSIKIPILK